MLISDEFAPLRVREREQHMEKTHEKHLEQINQCLDRIELDLMDKPDSEDLEFKWEELVAKLEQIHDEVTEIKDGMEGVMDRFELEYELYQMTSKLEEIHDEMRELKGEVADVKSQIDDLENGDWP
jgi:DNA repair ATPase RecN